MKKNLKGIATMFALCLFLVGLGTSISSFDSVFQMAGVLDTGTGTGTGTDTGTDSGESIPNSVLVAGIDCSWKTSVYDPVTGAILGYWVYTATYSDCLDANKTCKASDKTICTVIKAPVYETK